MRIAASIAFAAAAAFVAHAPAGEAGESNSAVRLEAVIASGGAPLDDGVRVKISRLRGGESDAIVARSMSLPAEVSLPPGHYRATVAYRETRVRRDFTVTGEAGQRHVFDLRAGRIRLGLLPHLDGRVLARPASWRVVTYGRDSRGRRLQVATAVAARPEFLLPQGYYVVQATLNGSTLSHTVEVRSGRTYDYTLNLDAGALRVHTARAGDDSDVPVEWSVYAHGAAGGAQPLARGEGAERRFLLRQGRYRVVARAGERSGEADVTITPGRTRSVGVALR